MWRHFLRRYLSNANPPFLGPFSQPQAVHSVAWLDLAHPQRSALRSMQSTTLAFGNGRSYGDILPPVLRVG
jgi:hypothetical protein